MSRLPTDDEWRERAARSARLRVPDRGAVLAIELLPRHASLRRYARARFERGTEIVMLMPPADAAPDEVGSPPRPALHDDPFVVVGRWLDGAGVPVPALHAIDLDADALWLDDLGGTDFDTWVSSEPDALEDRYRAALDLLIGFQTAVAASPAPPVVRDRSFGRELLRWELDHYVEWRVEAWLGRSPTAAQREALDRAFTDLVDELASIPTHPMHRDFQSHNIMVRDGALVLLDFQDAMMGPLVYDAVALLRDSYVRIPPKVLVSLVRAYADRASAIPGAPSASASDIERWVHVQTLQRKLKDAARFVYIDRVKANPSFLGYIEPSAAYVREAFGFLGDAVDGLATVLRDIDPEVVP